MPKQTTTQYIGMRFSVGSGTLTTEEGEQPIKMLIATDGIETLRFPMPEAVADKLADELRGDGIVTAKALPKMAVPKGR